jgi:uncharacterized membrane protein YkvA (DUF1232 family)
MNNLEPKTDTPGDLPPKEADFYQKLRERVSGWIGDKGKDYKWMEYVILLPDMFHLLVKLSLDRDVPAKPKVALAFGIAYLMSPVDLIPDFIPLAGYLDDIAVVAYILNNLINTVDPAVIRRHWAGEEDILEVVQHIIASTDEMIGKGLWRKIVKLVKSKM